MTAIWIFGNFCPPVQVIRSWPASEVAYLKVLLMVLLMIEYEVRIEIVKEKPTSSLVMVTGATGFVGGNLALTLAKRGYRVRALVRDLARANNLEKAGIHLVQGDIVNRAQVEEAARDVHTIYHIAALYRSARYPDDIYKQVNVEGTRNIVTSAKKSGVQRLVHCSTIGVHGDIKSVPGDENSPFDPGDIYQQTKLEGEMVVQEAIKEGLPATIFRPSGVYGPGDMRLLKIFESIHLGRFRIIGTGKALYHLIYIDDLVEGIILCGEKPEAVGQTYILAGPQYTTITELSRKVASAVNRKLPPGKLPLRPLKVAAAICEGLYRPFGLEPPLYRRRLDFFYKNRAFSIDKAKKELGFNPVVDLDQGLTRTADWYFDKGLLNGKIHIRFRKKKNKLNKDKLWP
ncbi:MAG: NAD-dependent epimerase/dehydratase family protein [Actinomycetota bacterium]|nr:NAD-dependent epimerase/dehydratase family protein [Actinomycetota bacterium]